MVLALHTVTGFNYCPVKNITDHYQGVQIEILLERPVFGNFLTQFLPTLLILIIW